MSYFIVNNVRIEIQDESKVNRKFKHQFNKILISLLSEEKLITHLKILNIRYRDSGYAHSVNDVEKGELDGGVDSSGKSVILDIGLDYASFYIDRFGERELEQALRSLLAHELVHYVHMSLNREIRNSYKVYEKVHHIYQRKYSEFSDSDSFLVMQDLTLFMVRFLAKLIEEGFANLYVTCKNGKLIFSKEFFNRNHAKSVVIAKRYNSIFEQLKRIDNKKKFIAKAKEILYAHPTPEYELGFHIVYSLIYLGNEQVDESIEHISHIFVTFFGKAKPKKLIRDYEKIMLRNGHNPVIGFSRASVLNVTEIEREWKRRYKL